MGRRSVLGEERTGEAAHVSLLKSRARGAEVNSAELTQPRIASVPRTHTTLLSGQELPTVTIRTKSELNPAVKISSR